MVTFIFVYDVEALLKDCKIPNEFNLSSNRIIIFTVQLITAILSVVDLVWIFLLFNPIGYQSSILLFNLKDTEIWRSLFESIDASVISATATAITDVVMLKTMSLIYLYIYKVLFKEQVYTKAL